MPCFCFLPICCKKTAEIVIPELNEMRIAHIVSIGSESLCGLTPDFEDGYVNLPFGFISIKTLLKYVFWMFILDKVVYLDNIYLIMWIDLYSFVESGLSLHMTLGQTWHCLGHSEDQIMLLLNASGKSKFHLFMDYMPCSSLSIGIW